MKKDIWVIKKSKCRIVKAIEVTCPYCEAIQLTTQINPNSVYNCENIYCLEEYIMGDTK